MQSAFKSAVIHLRNQGLWVFLGRAFLSGGSLLSSVILARLMTQEEMGTYRLVLSGINLVAVLALPGVFEVLIRHIPRGGGGIYAGLFRLRLKVGVLSVIGFAWFCIFTFDKLTLEQSVPLGLIALILPLYLASQMYEAGYQAQMKFRELSTIYVGRTVFQLVSYLGAFLLFGSVFNAVTIMISVMTAYYFWNHLRIQRGLAENTDATNVPISVVTREAVLISIFTILPSIMANIDTILVERSLGLDRLAVYSMGMSLGLAVNAFFKPFLNSINAKLVHRTPEMQHYALIVIGGTLIGGVISLVSPYLVPFLYGESYAESVPISIVVTTSMGLYFWNTLYYNHSMFNKEKRLKVIYCSNISMASGTIAYILLMVYLIIDPKFLILAVAFAYPIRMILSTFSLCVFGRLLR